MLEHTRQVSYQISRSTQEKFEFNGLRTEDGYSSGFWRCDALRVSGVGTPPPEVTLGPSARFWARRTDPSHPRVMNQISRIESDTHRTQVG
jgi:hypothetical protein